MSREQSALTNDSSIDQLDKTSNPFQRCDTVPKGVIPLGSVILDPPSLFRPLWEVNRQRPTQLSTEPLLAIVQSYRSIGEAETGLSIAKSIAT